MNFRFEFPNKKLVGLKKRVVQVLGRGEVRMKYWMKYLMNFWQRV